MSFTLSNLQTQVAYKLNETAAPLSSSDDYTQRTAFANEAIRHWSKRADWNILKTYSSTLVTVNTQNYVVLPLDFTENSLSGKLYLVDSTGAKTEYPVIAYEDKDDYSSDSRLAYTAYDITTNRWRLYIQPTPTASGIVLDFQYKVIPPTLSADADVVLVANPDWAVNYVAARVRDSRDENAVAQNIDSYNEQLMQLMIQEDLKDNINTVKKVRTPFSRIGKGYGI
jgi:hypothetical protein